MRSVFHTTCLVLSLSACGGNQTSTTDTPTPTTPQKSSATSSSSTSTSTTTTTSVPAFTDIQNDILNVSCVNCHTAFSSYDGISNYVVAGDSASSSLYTMTTSGRMPQGGTALSSDLQDKLKAWIDAGAKND